MESHTIPFKEDGSTLLHTTLNNLIETGTLDEISNSPDAVRHHIYWHGNRNKVDNTLNQPLVFFIYQTTRHGPQNGYRLCFVRKGFRITSGAKEAPGEREDEIDLVEKEIPMGHREVVFLGRDAEKDASGEEGM